MERRRGGEGRGGEGRGGEKNAKRGGVGSKCSIVGSSVFMFHINILSSPLMFFWVRVLGSKHQKLSRTSSFDFSVYLLDC